MRKRFEVQHKVGYKLISETLVINKSRDDFPAIVAALKEIYNNNKYNEEVFEILAKKINTGKKATGRPGMNLWQIFVLAQIRLALNLDYDRLEMMVNSNSILRQLIGIETITGFEYIQINRQTIIDNVRLPDDKTLNELNDEIIKFGHDVFKKKESTPLSLKTDSFVVQSNVHFPTDYNLLWDSSRKALSEISKYKSKYPKTKEWRKSEDWRRELKTLSLILGRASAFRGKYRDEKIKTAAKNYLTKAKALLLKLENTKNALPIADITDLSSIYTLEYFISMIYKHIDLVERRLIKGETIPHQEKLFSIFETYTEWISKGKINKKVELGKLVSITGDQYGLILNHHIHEKSSDSQIVRTISEQLFEKYKIDTWSFDKGYWHKDNKLLLQEKVRKLIMPKKGKPNKKEKQEEQEKEFKKFRSKHSAVESNINELEHRGLDACPDKGYTSFKRYIALGITAYNLHKIGKQIIKQERLLEKSKQKLRA